MSFWTCFPCTSPARGARACRTAQKNGSRIERSERCGEEILSERLRIPTARILTVGHTNFRLLGVRSKLGWVRCARVFHDAVNSLEHTRRAREASPQPLARQRVAVRQWLHCPCSVYPRWLDEQEMHFLLGYTALRGRP